jgi:hypothetical protein
LIFRLEIRAKSTVLRIDILPWSSHAHGGLSISNTRAYGCPYEETIDNILGLLYTKDPVKIS